MLIEQTLDKLNAMKLSALAEAVQQQLRAGDAATLSFEERLGLVVDIEWTAREQRKLTRRLQAAKLRYPAAALEAIDFSHPRRLQRQQVLSLGSCRWIADHHNLLITGPTGIGKSFLACAFVERACRRGFTARYIRLPRLLHELAVGRGDGSYGRLLGRLARLDLLAIDDWLLAPLRDAERRDLGEVIEDRAERGSTLIASQLPVPDWHAVIGDPNQADALCDRLLHDTHRLELTGPSLRRTKAAPTTATKGDA
jgi:DNA replication protein DnaC